MNADIDRVATANLAETAIKKSRTVEVYQYKDDGGNIKKKVNQKESKSKRK